MNDDAQINIFKALADPTRLKLVKELATYSSKSCGDLSAKKHLSQPAMSHHFAKLVSAGVVNEHKDGTKKFYKLNHELLQQSGIDVSKL